MTTQTDLMLARRPHRCSSKHGSLYRPRRVATTGALERDKITNNTYLGASFGVLVQRVRAHQHYLPQSFRLARPTLTASTTNATSTSWTFRTPIATPSRLVFLAPTRGRCQLLTVPRSHHRGHDHVGLSGIHIPLGPTTHRQHRRASHRQGVTLFFRSFRA